MSRPKTRSRTQASMPQFVTPTELKTVLKKVERNIHQRENRKHKEMRARQVLFTRVLNENINKMRLHLEDTLTSNYLALDFRITDEVQALEKKLEQKLCKKIDEAVETILVTINTLRHKKHKTSSKAA